MKKIRLPLFIKPRRYELFIKPDLKAFTFEGRETIYLTLDKSVKAITLHSKELTIQNAKFRIQNLEFRSTSIKFNSQDETATITFNRSLPKGQGQLILSFKGVLNDKMRGFYRSRYTAHQGREKHIATTQFEATDARRAFPCFDEPAHKAVFDVTLKIPKGLTAISNTIETAVAEDNAGYKVVKFAPTPKMSTYLLAFIVGDFEYIEGWTKPSKIQNSKFRIQNSKGTLVRVFVTPGKKHQAKFALDTAIRCLEFYNEYFDIPYPLPVLDLIAIPDFSSAAMENWGAVTYRESALLIDPEHSSLSSKQWVAIVIAHELAHQWFGNLVTMKWWTHLWLNEGFASYMEHLTTDKLFPQWKIWQQYVSGRLQQALELDALRNTHPVEVVVNHPSEISEIFDAVSYAKGSALIRMLADYLGEKTFRRGLRHYLQKHSYNNASTADLWRAFEKVSGKQVKKIMAGWTQKPGYPLITAKLQKNILVLKQSRFFSSSAFAAKRGAAVTWQIPLTYLSGNQSKKILLTSKSAAVKLKNGGLLLKLNSGESGLFRTAYSPELLSRLGRAVKSGKLRVADRLGVIRDAFALAESANISSTRALELVKNYRNETDYSVWVAIASGLAKLDGLIFDESCHSLYRKFCLDLFSPLAKKLGWRKKQGESDTQTLLRSLALRQAGKYGNKDIIDKSLSLFKAPEEISADLKGVVYSLSAASGNTAFHKKLIAMYSKSPLQEEKERIARALASFTDKRLLQKTLDFSLTKKVRFQDAPFIVVMVLMNNRGTEAGWKFVKKNWKIFLQRYGNGGLQMVSRIAGGLDAFKTSNKAREVEKFFKSHPAPGAKRTIQQALEKIYSNEAWLKRDYKSIADFLKTQCA